MIHVLDDDLTDALDKVEEYAPLWAKAKKDRVVLEEFKRSKRSELFLKASGSTVAEKEHWAYAHKDYKDVIEGLGIATEEEGRLWHMSINRVKALCSVTIGLIQTQKHHFGLGKATSQRMRVVRPCRLLLGITSPIRIILEPRRRRSGH